MSEEIENKECHCKENGEHTCTCGENCECENTNEEKECHCKNEGHTCTCEDDTEQKADILTRMENLLTISVFANVISAIFIIIIALLLSFNNNDFSLDFGQNTHQTRAIFKGKTLSIEEAKQNNKPSIVLFYADWCPHCRNFGPTFSKLSKDRTLKKKLNFVRVNSEDMSSRKYMEEFKVQGFPSLYLYNPKANEIIPLSNSLLFGEDAKENLKEIFITFANKK